MKFLFSSYKITKIYKLFYNLIIAYTLKSIIYKYINKKRIFLYFYPFRINLKYYQVIPTYFHYHHSH